MGNSKSKKKEAASSSAPPASSAAAQPPRPATSAAATAASAGSGGGGEEDDVQMQHGGEAAEFKGEDAKGADGDSAYSFWDRNKTFKPQRQLPNNRQQQLQNTMKATMKATLGGGELQQTVKLPPGEDLNEWIAVNTVHFFNAASMIYGTCAEFCTEQSCPTMSAGKAEYLWKDGNKYKKPTRVAAPLYIDLLLNWVDEQISNPSIFPVDENAKFPRNFKDQVKQIYKRLFRLYAHLYCFTPDHQILTDRGFIFVDQLKDGDNVAAYDPAAEALSFSPCVAIVRDVGELEDGSHRIYEVSSTGLTEAASSPCESTTGASNISFTVTADHEIWSRLDKEDRNGNVLKYQTIKKNKEYEKLPMSAFHEHLSDERGCGQVLVAAKNGVVGEKDVMKLPFVEALKLKDEKQVEAFLELYGYWLADGSLAVNSNHSPTVQFSQVKQADIEFIEERFAALGLQCSTHYWKSSASNAEQVQFDVKAPHYVSYFVEEYGRKYLKTEALQEESKGEMQGEMKCAQEQEEQLLPAWVDPKSAKWYWMWVRRLPGRLVRMILHGLRQADGAVMTHGDSFPIWTSSVMFRDQTVELAIRAGYSVNYFMEYSKGSKQDNWRIECSDTVDRILRHGDSKEGKFKGNVYCVSVGGSGLIMARKVMKSERIGDSNGKPYINVLEASRAIIIGNCEHMERIRSIGANAHLNTCFKHFVYFVLEFNLLDKADMAPLEKLIGKFIDKDKEPKS